MKKNQWSIILQNQVVAIVLALVLLVPVLFAVSGARRADQLTAYGFLGLVLLVVWLLRAQDQVSLEKLRTFVTTGPNLPILLYLAWGLLSIVVSVDRFYSQLALIQVAFGALIYAMVVYQFRHRMQIRTLLTSIVLVGVLLVLGAFVLDAEHHLMDLAGSFHDRQLFGAFLGLILPVLVGVAAGAKNPTYKIGAQLAALLIAAALLLTRCRSSWLGVALALGVFLVLSVVFVWKWKRIQRRKHELLITPALAVVVLGIFLFFTRMGGPVQWRAATFGTLGQDASVSDRMHLWSVADKMIEARPVAGWGIGAYEVAQIRFNPESRGGRSVRQTGPSLSESPHNTYLQIGAEQGLVGLGLYLGILGMFFLYGIRALPRLDRGLRQYVLIGCLAALAGQAVDAVANPGWMYPEVQMFFWLVLGLGMSAAGLGQEVVPEARAARTGEEPVLGVPRFLYRGIRTALIGCTALALGAQMLNLNFTSVAYAKDVKKPKYHKPPHGGDHDEDNNDKGLSGPEDAGLAAGGAALVGTAAAGAAGVFDAAGGAFPIGEPAKFSERYPELPADENRLKAIRLVPESSTLEAGFERAFHLEVQTADGKWYSVTNRPEARIAKEDPASPLELEEGTKNVFMVPSDTPFGMDGKTATLVGTFTPPGQEPMTARAVVTIQVPD